MVVGSRVIGRAMTPGGVIAVAFWVAFAAFIIVGLVRSGHKPLKRDEPKDERRVQACLYPTSRRVR